MVFIGGVFQKRDYCTCKSLLTQELTAILTRPRSHVLKCSSGLKCKENGGGGAQWNLL